MKVKLKIRLAVDILMTLALLFLMGYQLWGERAHEWAGTGMFVLFIAHHLLNAGWHRNLLRGRYTLIRILISVINIALFVVMICLMISGIMMSRHVFAFLPITGGMGMARLPGIFGPLCRILGILTAGYGLYVFVTRDLASYMFLRTQFVFLDYSESLISFYIDYLAMMGLFIWIAHYLSAILRKSGK